MLIDLTNWLYIWQEYTTELQIPLYSVTIFRFESYYLFYKKYKTLKNMTFYKNMIVCKYVFLYFLFYFILYTSNSSNLLRIPIDREKKIVFIRTNTNPEYPSSRVMGFQ